MRFRVFKRTVMAGLLFGVAVAAMPQIPVPPPPPIPLPGLEVQIVAGKPPAPRVEKHGVSPGVNYVWVGGFWNWRNTRWSWVPGRWEARPVRHAYWIPAHYVHVPHGYIYEPGHWSNQTVIVSDEVRRNREWRYHERDHEREREREYHD